MLTSVLQSEERKWPVMSFVELEEVRLDFETKKPLSVLLI